MEKQTRRFAVDYSLDWTYGVSIKKMREDLDALEKLGVTVIDIEPYSEWDCSYVRIDAFAERQETDEEMNERAKKEQAIKEEYKRRDLRQLEELKAKYGL